MSQPATPLTKIGIVMLGVASLDRSVAFYRDLLGLKLQTQFPGFAFFEGGGVTLVLSEPLAKAVGVGPGATEVVFSVEGVRAAYDALRARGLAFTQEPRNVSGPMWAANFADPDGHRLSIFGPERKV
jgi:catechol 2,3-dioxygenase-like lactoylglutathione lyase family enzyme